MHKSLSQKQISWTRTGSRGAPFSTSCTLSNGIACSATCLKLLNLVYLRGCPKKTKVKPHEIPIVSRVNATLTLVFWSCFLVTPIKSPSHPIPSRFLYWIPSQLHEIPLDSMKSHYIAMESPWNPHGIPQALDRSFAPRSHFRSCVTISTKLGRNLAWRGQPRGVGIWRDTILGGSSHES